MRQQGTASAQHGQGVVQQASAGKRLFQQEGRDVQKKTCERRPPGDKGQGGERDRKRQARDQRRGEEVDQQSQKRRVLKVKCRYREGGGGGAGACREQGGNMPGWNGQGTEILCAERSPAKESGNRDERELEGCGEKRRGRHEQNGESGSRKQAERRGLTPEQRQQGGQSRHDKGAAGGQAASGKEQITAQRWHQKHRQEAPGRSPAERRHFMTQPEKGAQKVEDGKEYPHMQTGNGEQMRNAQLGKGLAQGGRDTAGVSHQEGAQTGGAFGRRHMLRNEGADGMAQTLHAHVEGELGRGGWDGGNSDQSLGIGEIGERPDVLERQMPHTVEFARCAEQFGPAQPGAQLHLIPGDKRDAGRIGNHILPLGIKVHSYPAVNGAALSLLSHLRFGLHIEEKTIGGGKDTRHRSPEYAYWTGALSHVGGIGGLAHLQMVERESQGKAQQGKGKTAGGANEEKWQGKRGGRRQRPGKRHPGRCNDPRNVGAQSAGKGHGRLGSTSTVAAPSGVR